MQFKVCADPCNLRTFSSAYFSTYWQHCLQTYLSKKHGHQDGIKLEKSRFDWPVRIASQISGFQEQRTSCRPVTQELNGWENQKMPKAQKIQAVPSTGRGQRSSVAPAMLTIAWSRGTLSLLEIQPPNSKQPHGRCCSRPGTWLCRVFGKSVIKSNETRETAIVSQKK